MLWISSISILAMLIAFGFGRKFKGVVGKILDLLVFLAGIQAALPCLLLLGRPEIAWFVGVWVLGWQGAYQIGNIDNVKTRWGVLAIWIAVLTLILVRLGNGFLPEVPPGH